MIKNIVIDGNNLMYRAYHKFKTKSRKGIDSSAAYGFPYILRSLINQQKADKVLVVFDGKVDKNRLAIHPGYKGTRGAKKKARDFDQEQFVSQQVDIKKMLKALGVPVIHKSNREADDLMWLYTRKAKRKGEAVVIVSTDKDFNQLLSPNISIWHPWKNKRITHKNLINVYGYTPEQCVDYLSLVGDKSDNIEGKKGFGDKTTLKFIKEYGSLLKYIRGAGEEMNKFTRSEAKELYNMNRALIDLRFFARTYLKGEKINIKSSGKIDRKELAIICSKYDISTFTDDSFIKTFKNLK